MTTVIDVVHAFMDEQGMLETGIATGGTTTTLIDSSRIMKDDVWQGGFIFIDSTTDGLAPQGEAAEITAAAYAAATGSTFTFAALTATITAADIYSIAAPAIPMEKVKRLMNRALSRLGYIPCVDTSLTGVSGTPKYSLPVACKGKVLRVYIDANSSATDPDWEERTDFHEHPLDTGGTAGYLLFDEDVTAGTMKIIYRGVHAKAWTNTAVISEYVPLQRLLAEMSYLYFMETKRRTEGENRGLATDFNIAAQELELARKQFPIWMPGRAPRLILRALDTQ